MTGQNVALLNSGSVSGGDAQAMGHDSPQFPALSAGEPDSDQTLRGGYFHSLNDIRRIAAGRNAKCHVARAAECLDWADEDQIVSVVVCEGGEGGSIGGEREGGKGGALS